MDDEQTTTLPTERPDTDAFKDLPPEFHKTFTHGGVTYIYNFRLCNIQQVLLAKSVFDLAATMRTKPPRDFKSLELSGQMDYMAKAFGYLFRQQLPGATPGQVMLEKFDRREAREVIAPWISDLPASLYSQLEECRRDFFEQADIIEFDSIMRFMPLLNEFPASAFGQGVPPTPNGSGSSQNTNSDSLDSTDLTN
jgi:hypothetical protein